MKLISIFSIIIVILQSSLYAEMSNKRVYDATGYLHKNGINRYIFPPITILYQNMLLPKGANNIDYQFLQKYARSLPFSKTPYILDIEAWDIRPNVPDLIANKRIDKYIAVIKTLKNTRPDLKFGYYGILPVRDYVATQQSQQALKKWHHANMRVKRLAKYVDIVCPDLYTFFYEDRKYWKEYASLSIKDARTYGKPIFPFVWPEYHNSDKKLAGKYIDKSFWEFQINFLFRHADGIIIWGGRNLNVVPHTSKTWNDNAPWWKTTKKIIMKYKK